MLVVILGYFTAGCGFFDFLFGPTGFTVRTTFITAPTPTQRSVESPDPNVSVIGNWQGDNGFQSPSGNTFSFAGTTDGDGKLKISDGRTPAVWIFSRNGGRCGIVSNISHAISAGQTVTLPCNLAGLTFSMSPDYISVYAPPPSVTLSGAGLNATYGMPIVEYYDEYGTFLEQTIASSIAVDGTWMQANMVDISGAPSGAYTLVIRNATPDGSRDVVGTAYIYIFGNDPLPPEPIEPCQPYYNAMDYNDVDYNRPAMECEVVF